MTALHTQEMVESRVERGEAPASLVDRVSAYRAGYWAEDRRRLERELNDGTLLGAATTTALELGVDIAGLDAVVVAGFPGTVASFWQQAGRAGRRNQGSLVVLVGKPDPLDTFLLHHPEALLDKPVEMTVTNPANENLLLAQLWNAVAELPLGAGEVAAWSERDGVDVGAVLERMHEWGMVRYRPQQRAWYPTGRYDEAWSRVHLRGGAADEVAVVCVEDGRLLEMVDVPRACEQLHHGAVYVHQGDSFVVEDLNLDEGIALVSGTVPPWTTYSRADTDVMVEEVVEEQTWGRGADEVTVGLARVRVVRQVTGYERKATSGELIDVVHVDLPPTELVTEAVFYHMGDGFFRHCGVDSVDVPGSLHAAEHAAIGMLPLVVDCDRSDIGGLSTPLHGDTGEATVFVYDGYPGGAGYASYGYRTLRTWLASTHDAIAACSCTAGCPSCIQSPKCGNANNPLNKPGALRLLHALLTTLGGDASGE